MSYISRIIFNKYRQYKETILDFPLGLDGNLFVLKFNNEEDKRIFLNGIFWCLYGVDYYLTDEEKNKNIDDSTLEKYDNGTVFISSVIITVDDGFFKREFFRAQWYQVEYDPIKSQKIVVPGISQSLITVYPHCLYRYNSSYGESDSDVVLKAHFISCFNEYFMDLNCFDGEKLKNHFMRGESEKVKETLQNVSEFTLLNHPISEIIEKLKYELGAEGLRCYSDEEITEQISKLKSILKKLVVEYEKVEDDNSYKHLEEIQECDVFLYKFKLIKSLLRERKALAEKNEILPRQINKLEYENSLLALETIILLKHGDFFYDALDRICYELESRGIILDQKELKSQIEYYSIVEPPYDEEAVDKVKELVDQLDISSATTDYLMQIRKSVEELIDREERVSDRLKANFRIRKNLLKQKGYNKTIITSIHDNIIWHYSDDEEDDYNEDVTFYEDLKYCYEIGNDCIEIEKRKAKRSIKLLAAILDIRKKSKRDGDIKELLNKQFKTYKGIITNCEKVKAYIVDKTKEKIERRTWERFCMMICGKNLKGRISIDDSGKMSLFNDNEVIDGLSETEYLALAYSFKLTALEELEDESPIIVSTPFGGISDDNKIIIALEMLKVSKEKQIIMALTSDEYFNEVEDIFSQSRVFVKTVETSLNEKKDV